MPVHIHPQINVIFTERYDDTISVKFWWLICYPQLSITCRGVFSLPQAVVLVLFLLLEILAQSLTAGHKLEFLISTCQPWARAAPGNLLCCGNTQQRTSKAGENSHQLWRQPILCSSLKVQFRRNLCFWIFDAAEVSKVNLCWRNYSSLPQIVGRKVIVP